jgi:MATE family multidrug resistance protein
MADLAPIKVPDNFVTSGPPHRAILRLALPTVAAMLTQSVVNEIDILFFARLPCPESSNAQAALLPSLILLWLFGGSLSAIGVGTQAFTARRFAEGDKAAAGAVLANAFTFALLAGALFAGLGYLSVPYILPLLIKNEGARLAAESYLQWRLLGIISMAVTFAFKAFFDGIGKTHVHLVSALVMNAINIALCIVLIFGSPALGIGKMGIAGAGLAGVISTYVGLAIMVGYALKPEYRRDFRPFDLKKLDRSLLGSILRLSIPGGVATIAVMTGFAFFAAIASRLDEIQPLGVISAQCPGGSAEPVNGAATTVIVGVLKLTFSACLAFGTATATLVSQSLGEKDPEKAERFGWASVKLALLIFGVIGLVQTVFAEPILAIATRSPEVQQAALFPMRIMGVCTPLIAVGMILTQALFGAGNSRFVMVIELVLHFTCLVPLAWLLGIHWEMGIVGLWSAALVYIVLLAIIMVWKFKGGSWKTIKL